MRGKSIIMTSNHIDQHYIRTLKGERSDTKELNINIKTLTLAHLRHLENANELSSEQCEIVRNYAMMSACFESINYLFFGKDAPIKLKKTKQAGSSEFQPNQQKENSSIYEQARGNIRNYCKDYFRSTYFIKNFLRSPRMNPKNKLIILKFLRKIECLPFRKFKEKSFQWKNLDFEN